MRILHFSLGLPPYRSGGLTKYVTDLMVSQSESGDEVSLLYPGDYTFWRVPKVKIIKDQNYNGILVYKIENPIIVPLRHGVKNPLSITYPKYRLTLKDLEIFYDQIRPDLMHVHTLMGLPEELLNYLKYKGVKILFTTHDYYGLCLKVNFIDQKGLLCDLSDKEKCAICNRNSPDQLFLRLRNSKYLLKYKKRLASNARKLEEPKTNLHEEIIPTQKKIEEYGSLLSHYNRLFEQIDFFHFNSNVTKECYEKHLTPKKSNILPISNANISDNRKIRSINKSLIRIGYIGSMATYKGYPLLKSVLNFLNKKGINNWILQIWGGKLGKEPLCEFIEFKGEFTSSELERVFDQIDLLIVPSIWKETFSFITLEALSFGLPVLVSENVGAKDIVETYDPFFVFQQSKEELQLKLEAILGDPTLIENFNNKICQGSFDYSLKGHVLKLKELYINTINGKNI